MATPPTPRIEPLRFYRNLVFWPLRKRGLAGLGSTLLMGFTQVAMVAGYAYDWASDRRAS